MFFDEVQNLDNWAPQLKSLADSTTLQAIVTGSSALRIEAGRDSLAGRITTIEAGTLSLTEIAALRDVPLGSPFLEDNGLEPLSRPDFWCALREHGRARGAERDAAFTMFSDRGGYPMVHRHAEIPWEFVAGRLAESVVGSLFSSVNGLDVAHFPERPGQPEVDFVLSVGARRIPVEVKYQARIDPFADTEGLRAFVEKSVNQAPFGLLVTQDDSAAVPDPRIVSLPLSSLLLLR